MATEAVRRAVNKYNKTHMRQFVIRLNKKTDADIIKRLDAQKSKQGYVKSLIRADIKKPSEEKLL